MLNFRTCLSVWLLATLQKNYDTSLEWCACKSSGSSTKSQIKVKIWSVAQGGGVWYLTPLVYAALDNFPRQNPCSSHYETCSWRTRKLPNHCFLESNWLLWSPLDIVKKILYSHSFFSFFFFHTFTGRGLKPPFLIRLRWNITHLFVDEILSEVFIPIFDMGLFDGTMG